MRASLTLHPPMVWVGEGGEGTWYHDLPGPRARGELTLDLLTKAFESATEGLRGQGEVGYLRVGPEVRDAYVRALIADRHFVNTMRLEGGRVALEFMGVPIVPDRTVPPDTIVVVPRGREGEGT